MKPIKSINSLLFIGVMATLIASITGFNMPAVFGVLLFFSFFMPKGYAFMALTKEIWQNDIIENLYKDNQFANYCVNADRFVLAGKVVHIPVSGAAATTKKNLTSFPQTAVNRADTELTYTLDTIYSLPRQIQQIEQYELSYDKRQSVVGDDQKKLIQDAMNSLLYRWAPAAANVITTTGGATTEDLIDGTATGGRLVFTKNEVKKISKKLANSDITGQRYGLLTAFHYHQFFDSLSEGEKTNFGRVADLAKGVVGEYMGIKLMLRSSVLRYRKVANVWTVVDEQDDAFAAGTGDSAASLFWVDSCVERARGDVFTFEDNGNPLYYGDVFSALIRLGGRQRRASGVYAVVEDIAP